VSVALGCQGDAGLLEQLRALIEAMATNPTMLAEDTLAELASILGRRAL
jgi:hypothetical protein